MGGRVRVRRADRDDAAAISALIVPLAERWIVHEFTDEGRRNFLASVGVDAIRGYLDGGMRYHVAEDEVGLLGVVATRDDAHLYHLFVAERARRRGVARELWRVACAASRDAGYRGDFTVNSSRHAVGLYERLGFARCGDEDERGGVASVPMRSKEDPPC